MDSGRAANLEAMRDIQRSVSEVTAKLAATERAPAAAMSRESESDHTDEGEETAAVDPNRATIADLRRQVDTLKVAGEEYDCYGPLYNNQFSKPTVPKGTPDRPLYDPLSQLADPRHVLMVKAQATKVNHIHQFLSDKAQARRKARQRDPWTRAGTDETAGTLVIWSEDPHPYRGISHDEWSAANMRLLSHLLLVASRVYYVFKVR